MKNILLLVHADRGQESRFQAALDLARTLDGHLTCLEAAVPPPLLLDPVSVASAEAAADDAAFAGDRLQARLAAEDVGWDWLIVTEDIVPALAEAARLADIIVLPTPEPDGVLSLTGGLIRRLLDEARKPVLLVPPRLERLDVTAPVLIAWDGSIAAASAMSAAVPLLALAAGVTIIELGSDQLDVSAEEAAAYLSRHDIKVMVARRPLRGRRVADVLKRFADRGRFGYVVMGGLGRPPVVETLLGSVTSAMIAASRVPLFLAR